MDRQNCVRCGKPLSRFEAHEMTHCIEWLRGELETARAMCRKIDNGLSTRDWRYIGKQAADWFAGFIGQDTPGDGAGG